MKKTLFIFVILMLSLKVLSQAFTNKVLLPTPYYETFYNISEIEKSNGNDKNRYTLEDYISAIRINGSDEILNNAIISIENDTVDEYIRSLTESNISSKMQILVKDIYFIQYNMLDISKNHKLCFIYNNKLYVMTYAPLPNHNHEICCGKYDNSKINKRDFYIYRLDSDGWKKASNLIRTFNRCENNGNITLMEEYVATKNKEDEIVKLPNKSINEIYCFYHINWIPNNNPRYNRIKQNFVLTLNGNENFNVVLK